jgi:hypothetical protein
MADSNPKILAQALHRQLEAIFRAWGLLALVQEIVERNGAEFTLAEPAV